MKVFPSFRYHKEYGAKIIHSLDEHESHEALGWVESPEKFGPSFDSFKMVAPLFQQPEVLESKSEKKSPKSKKGE